jgi:4a-hydroxytetrahydrobiopterin dehydratase
VPRLLTRQEVQKELKKLNGWATHGKFITKAFEFENFMGGIEFVSSVAAVAEKLEHHPDIAIRYNKVTLSLQTHSAGGVTKWDVQLAKAIDKLDDGRRNQAGAPSERLDDDI